MQSGNGVGLYGSTRKSLSFLFVRDHTTILLPKNHAPERKESFYAKIKMSAFANFEVDRLIKKKKKKKKMEKSVV